MSRQLHPTGGGLKPEPMTLTGIGCLRIPDAASEEKCVQTKESTLGSRNHRWGVTAAMQWGNNDGRGRRVGGGTGRSVRQTEAPDPPVLRSLDCHQSNPRPPPPNLIQLGKLHRFLNSGSWWVTLEKERKTVAHGILPIHHSDQSQAAKDGSDAKQPSSHGCPLITRRNLTLGWGGRWNPN